MKGVYIFLADGFEDMEALATNDVLKRAGIGAHLVSISSEPFVQSSHGITVGVDCTLEDLNGSDEGTCEKDVMVFPGGMPGTRNLAACRQLVSMMQRHYDAGGTVAAICAAPGLVLGQLKGMSGKKFTCFDGFEELPKSEGACFVSKPAVTDGRIITGRSAGHAIAFALEIVNKIYPEKAVDVAHGLFLDTK